METRQTIGGDRVDMETCLTARHTHLHTQRETLGGDRVDMETCLMARHTHLHTQRETIGGNRDATSWLVS